MNEAIGEVESVAFENTEGDEVTIVSIRVPNGTAWGPGKVKITKLDN